MNAHLPIFVDDDDAAIVYDGAWQASRQLETDLHILVDPGSRNTPLYGTLHTTVTYQSIYKFSYIFHGTGFQAYFVGGFGLTAAPCMIDGITQSMTPLNGGFMCQNNHTLSPTEHNLTFALHITNELISFDGLFFTPTSTPIMGVDQQHSINTEMSNSGDIFQLNFDGISAGIYMSVSWNSVGVASLFLLSYHIDNSPPANFSLINPTQNAELELWTQLLIQTPLMPLGSHTLSVQLLVPAVDFFSLFVNFAIVQNTTRLINLEAVPNITTSVTASNTTASSSSKISNPSNSTITMAMITDHGHISHGAIAGIAVATFIGIFIALSIWRYTFRKREVTVLEPSSIPVPYSQGGTNPDGRYRLPLYAPSAQRTKTGQPRDLLMPPLDRGATPEGQENISAPRMESKGQVSSHSDQYGSDQSVPAERNNESDEDRDDIISLPPDYITLRRSLIVSHTLV